MGKSSTDRRNIWCFPLGTVGRDMVYVIVSNFLLTYIMFTRELTNGQLGAITAIMVAARIFDALNDPIMGNIIECTRTKWGKFKPWLVAGAISTSLVIAFLFNTKLQGWAFITAFGIAYFAFSITYTMNDISYWGMIPALSRDSGARDAITSRATLFAGIGNGLASVVIPVFTTGAMAIGGNTQSSYGIMAIIIGILSPLFLLFTVLFVKENRDDMKTKPAPVSLKKILKTITGNDQLVWISVCFLIQETGSMIIAGGLGSTYIYFTYGYKGGLYSTFTLVGMSATAFLMIFYPVIAGKLGRKKLMGWLLILSVAGYAMMLVSPKIGFWLLVIGFMCASFGQYGYYLIMMISIINTVEYNEYKFGTRDEAIIASLRPFLTKLSSALIVMITSGSYMLFGITQFTNKISYFENLASKGAITEDQKLEEIDKVLATVDGGKSTGILLVMVILSLILMAVSYFIYKKKYTLDEEEYKRICKEIDDRNH
ncbi:MFS transporter [Butyrivibrio proteoclasticus]|uniref:MFS transporter n=1 Tax=Butyrivibrio proteoclasticus TaxID=43305 RepID=UPI00047BF290|nr:glycoside-pentoside-hexuronide (GPH):cation symporter [Butyrivibrio proteoclasticus]